MGMSAKYRNFRCPCQCSSLSLHPSMAVSRNDQAEFAAARTVPNACSQLPEIKSSSKWEPFLFIKVEDTQVNAIIRVSIHECPNNFHCFFCLLWIICSKTCTWKNNRIHPLKPSKTIICNLQVKSLSNQVHSVQAAAPRKALLLWIVFKKHNNTVNKLHRIRSKTRDSSKYCKTCNGGIKKNSKTTQVGEKWIPNGVFFFKICF